MDIDPKLFRRGKRKDWPVEAFTLPEGPGIYLLTCNVTGDQYVGGTTAIKDRVFMHFRQARLSHRLEFMPPVTRCMHKHGVAAFSIKVVELCAAEDVPARERFWFAEINPSLNIQVPTGRPRKPRARRGDNQKVSA